MKNNARLATVLSALLLISACDQPLPSPKQKEQTPKAETTKQPVEAAYQLSLNAYQAQGMAGLQQTLACVDNLRSAIPVFLDQPEEQALQDLFDLARHCHRLYLPALALTASYPALDARLASLRRRIDSRPITPGYVDYVDGYPESGIVNDPALPLTRESLIAEQGLTDAGDVVLGFEVILFLLEGEHRYKPLLPIRTASDYQAVSDWPEKAGEDALPPTDHPNNRRRQYLILVAELLQQDLKLLRESWRTFALPSTQEGAHALVFAIVRNWHGVAVSLSAENVGEVTDHLMTLITTPDAETDIARLMKLDTLDGWPRNGVPLDPMVLSQSLGQWLVQHNR